MITQLQERHRPLFTSLTPPEVEFVWNRVSKRWCEEARNVPNPPDAEALFSACQLMGLDHARVVLSFAGENGPARQTIEKMIGHPIKAWAASVEAAQEALQRGEPGGEAKSPGSGPEACKPPRAVVRRVDPRLVAAVKPQPHRPGSEMHRVYETWIIGETVDQCRERGLTARSLRRDVKKGYVRLEGVAG